MRCRTLDACRCRAWPPGFSVQDRRGRGQHAYAVHYTSTHAHHPPALHRPLLLLLSSQTSISKHLAPCWIRLLNCRQRATVACSLTRIRNQRSAGVLRHWKRTIVHTYLHHCFAASAWLRLLVLVLVLVRTCPSLPAHHASHSTLRKLATDRHEASTFPMGRSVAPVEICVCPSVCLALLVPSHLLAESFTAPASLPNATSTRSPRIRIRPLVVSSGVLSQPETLPLALGICSPNPVTQPGLQGQA